MQHVGIYPGLFTRAVIQQKTANLVHLPHRVQSARTLQFEGWREKTGFTALLLFLAGAAGATVAECTNPVDAYALQCRTHDVTQCQFHKKGDEQTLQAMHAQFRTLQKDLTGYRPTQEIIQSLAPLEKLSTSEKQTMLEIAESLTPNDGLEQILASYNQFADKILVNYATPQEVEHSKQLMKGMIQKGQVHITTRNVFIAMMALGVGLFLVSADGPSSIYSFYKDYLSKTVGHDLADMLYPGRTTY